MEETNLIYYLNVLNLIPQYIKSNTPIIVFLIIDTDIKFHK